MTIGDFSPANGTFSGSGLNVGDTVHLAADPHNATLQSGAYLVATLTTNTFTLKGAVITPGDTYNYLAKVNTGEAPFWSIV